MPILAAYNEIALKSRYVRSTLERRLASQIEHVLRKAGYGEARARRQFGRIIVDGAPPEAAAMVANVLASSTPSPRKKQAQASTKSSPWP